MSPEKPGFLTPLLPFGSARIADPDPCYGMSPPH
jgi:hypothetical protein